MLVDNNFECLQELHMHFELQSQEKDMQSATDKVETVTHSTGVTPN